MYEKSHFENIATIQTLVNLYRLYFIGLSFNVKTLKKKGRNNLIMNINIKVLMLLRSVRTNFSKTLIHSLKHESYKTSR